MSDLDPQTRDLRAALHDTDPGVRAATRTGPSWVQIVAVVLILAGIVAYFGWGRTLLDAHAGKAPPPSAAPVAPSGG